MHEGRGGLASRGDKGMELQPGKISKWEMPDGNGEVDE